MQRRREAFPWRWVKGLAGDCTVPWEKGGLFSAGLASAPSRDSLPAAGSGARPLGAGGGREGAGGRVPPAARGAPSRPEQPRPRGG